MRLRGSIAIDLGTTNTLIWVTGRGLVIDEPSVIALDGTTGKVAAVGELADALAGKEPEDIEVIYPLRDGVIADLNATALMLKGFLRRANRHPGPLRPTALVCVPSRATWVERRSVAAALEARRPRARVRLVDEPVAAAAGAGIDLATGAGAFVVDVGGGTTEIAVVSGARVVRARSLRLAGNAMDDAIIQAARTELGLILGRKAATRLKMELGLTGGTLGWAEAVGIDAARRTPRVERVHGKLVATALEHVVPAIIRSVEQILSDIPPGIAEDVVRGKIRLAGGGALLPGLANRIEQSADIATVVAEDPLRCVIRGAAELLERGENLGAVGLPQLPARADRHDRAGPRCRGPLRRGLPASRRALVACGSTWDDGLPCAPSSCRLQEAHREAQREESDTGADNEDQRRPGHRERRDGRGRRAPGGLDHGRGRKRPGPGGGQRGHRRDQGLGRHRGDGRLTPADGLAWRRRIIRS